MVKRNNGEKRRELLNLKENQRREDVCVALEEREKWNSNELRH